MKKYIDSKIVELNNENYLVYLKSVPVRESREGKREAVRAFVKKLKKNWKYILTIESIFHSLH